MFGLNLCRLFIFLYSFVLVKGGYLITTPQSWGSGENTQICIALTEPASPGDILTMDVGEIHRNRYTPEENITNIFTEEFIINADGKTPQCETITVPDKDSRASINIKFHGILNGKPIIKEVNGTIQGNKELTSTFVQTDKYLYKPGQEVNFRVLTVYGPRIKLSYKSYPLIEVKSPSNTRIFQWLDVENSKGLVHLKFKLADEPDYGSYAINVYEGDQIKSSRRFKVEEYVLPRYEVTVQTPPYVRKIDDFVNVTVCANYTYGEPVQGIVNITVDNNQWGSCDTELNFEEPINGCRDFSFDSRKLYFQNSACSLYRLTLKAFVREEGTGIEMNAKRTSISLESVMLNFDTLTDKDNVKVNLPYEEKIKVTFPDGTIAPDLPFSVCWNYLLVDGKCKNFTSNSEGIIEFIHPYYTPVRIKSLSFGDVQSKFDEEFTVMYQPSHNTYSKTNYYSPTNSSLVIRSQPKVNCLKKGFVDVELDVMFVAQHQATAEVIVKIISRGQIQETTSHTIDLSNSDLGIDEGLLVSAIPELPENFTRGSFKLPIKLTQSLSPNPDILVWYVREDKEVVADSINIDIENCLNYDVSMSWSSPKVGPGEPSTLNIEAESSAVCSIGIVDKSVDLLSGSKNGALSVNDIFSVIGNSHFGYYRRYSDDNEYCARVVEKLKNESKTDTDSPLKPVLDEEELEAPLRRRSIILPPIHRGGYQTNDMDAHLLFQNTKLFTLTDLEMELRPCIAYHAPLAMSFAGPSAAFGGGVAEDSFSSKERAPGESDEARTYFPETWLWDIEVVGEDGTFSKTYNLPDTITEWVGHSVCVHGEQGVGLSSKVSVTTFTPFFIDLTMPAIVTRGEIIPIKISVFNYLDNKLPITMTLVQSDEYDILVDNTTDVSQGNSVHNGCINSKEKEVFTVRIRPKALGDVNITVTAQVDEAGECPNVDNISKRDAIIKPLKVEAEGFPRERTWSKLICSRDALKEENWEIDIPPVTVEGSDRAWVNINGDIIGPSLANIGNLIRMPYGCGEQNMINFAPNVFIRQYLEHSNQLTDEIRDKLMYYIRNGYQRQTKYRHSNGGYSVFGKNDYTASTWLTAFVVKSFAQARNYTYIDEQQLQQSIDWLAGTQGEDGCYNPIGNVLHKGMKGGIHKGKSDFLHTAYVAIALWESKLDLNETTSSLALQCLQSAEEGSYYGEALKAYALALAKDEGAAAAIDQLLQNANKGQDSISWNLKKLQENSDAVEVETAAYVVLAMMTVDPERYRDDAWKIIRWISTRRNAQGGFISTQDTVVALQALAVFEKHQPKNPLDLNMIISDNDAINENVIVNDQNKLLEQRTMIDNLPKNISINLEGNGCALAQAVLRYNAPDPDPSQAFVVNVDTSTANDRSCKMKTIKVCVAYITHLDDKSNMALIEVNLITGYVPVKEDLQKITGSSRFSPGGIFKRYEVDGRKVTFYADYFTKEYSCIEFRVQREIDVEEPQPGIVKVFDYYEPDMSISRNYELESPDHCNFEMSLPNNDGIMLENTCWRRYWQRPVENSNSESGKENKIATPLSTWCLPKQIFSELNKDLLPHN